MKLNHALVFSLLIIGVAFLAYKNVPGVAGMMYANSDGMALGGPIYSSQKANIGIGRLGGQAGQSYANASNRSLVTNLQRYVRGQ
jgi:hypothetical protein